MKRFVLMAVLGAMLCGSLIAGCGGSSDEDTTTTPRAMTTNSPGNTVGGNAVGGDDAP